MIYDSLKHMEAYQGVHPGIYKGLELLRDTDFSKLEDARVEVDGEDLFYLLQSYESKPANDTPEAHKKYVDIQFLISGREKMGVGALEDMKEEVEAHPERDIWFYHGPLDEITLGGDKFVVIFPGDAHAPNIAVDRPEPVLKCVEEVKAGNNEFRQAAGQTLEAVEAMDLPEVDYFIEHFLPAFGLTLDELQ